MTSLVMHSQQNTDFFAARLNICQILMRWAVTKAELLQLNRTQFPSLGIFVSKKVGNPKKIRPILSYQFLKVVYWVVLVFSISNYFINKNSQGRTFSAKKKTYFRYFSFDRNPAHCKFCKGHKIISDPLPAPLCEFCKGK